MKNQTLRWLYLGLGASCTGRLSAGAADHAVPAGRRVGLRPQLAAPTTLVTRPSTLRNAAARLYRTPRDTPESEVYRLAGDALECRDRPWHCATPTVGAVACQPGAGDGLVYRELPKYANPGCRLISS